MAIDHVVDAAGSTDDDVLPRLQNADVLLYVGAADAGVTENAHVVTQSQHNLRVACITFTKESYADQLPCSPQFPPSRSRPHHNPTAGNDGTF